MLTIVVKYRDPNISCFYWDSWNCIYIFETPPTQLLLKQFTSLYTLLFPFSLLILVTSCQKDPAADVFSEEACKLAKAHYFNNAGGLEDSLVYTYTNNKISKAENADLYITFTYSNDKITKRSFYDADSQELALYDVATYNSDGTLKNIKRYANFTNQVIPYHQYEFTYSGDKLAKFDVSYYNTSTSQYELYESTTYVYTGNNITQSTSSDPSGTMTFSYAYDTNTNYFKKSNALLVDLYFLEEISGSTVPLFMSSNNVIKAFEYGDEFPISYVVDDENNLTEWYLNGVLDSQYFYDCK